MPFAWSNIKQQQVIQQKINEPEDVQIVTLPVYDKISAIEHKNVEVDGTRKKDDEVGIGKKEING
jgi:hypothetical protein